MRFMGERGVKEMNLEENVKDVSVNENIKTLGIPKSYKCSGCGRRVNLGFSERKNLADCIMANYAGLWALSHCKHCGYVDKIYPIRINRVNCTPAECDKLFEEIKKYDKKAGGKNEN